MSIFQKLKKWGNDPTSPICCTKFKLCHDFIHANAESPQNDKELGPIVERVQSRFYSAQASLCQMQHSYPMFSEKSAYLMDV